MPSIAKPPQIDAAKAAEMAEQPGTRLVDVRGNAEWHAGHAPAAEHCPLDTLDPSTFQGNDAIVVVCRSGNRSQKAAEMLHGAGVTVYNLDGGMAAWESHGLTIIRNDGTPGTVA